MSAFGPLFDLHIKNSSRRSTANRRGVRLNLDPYRPHIPTMPGWKWRIAPIVCTFTLVVAILAGRLWQLQIINGASNLAASHDNSITIKPIPAPRGVIYDRHGTILARNTPSFSLTVTPANLPTDPEKRRQSIAKTAKLASLSVDTINQRIEQAMQNPVVATVVKPSLDRDTEIALLATQSQLPGFSVEEDFQRSYPLGAAFSHILGYTGSISAEELERDVFANYHPGEIIGKAGLEQHYEKQLHGQRGQRLTQVDATGVLQSAQTEQEPVVGHNITLSIDSELQQKTYEVLQQAMKEYHPTGAVGIFQDPTNGQVLASVSLPSFDNNLFAGGISQQQYQKLANDPLRPLFDRSIAGVYPPGSTVKPLIGGGAVADGVITPETIINSPSFINIGTYRYADWTFWLGRAAPGPINVVQAIAQSSDTFFYQLGGGYQEVKGMGVKALSHYYTQAGFGSLTGIDLPGEVPGVVPDPAWKAKQFPEEPTWFLGNTYQLAIGQSYLLTTPLQINSMTTAIANGGTLLRPQILSRVTDESGKVITQSQPEAIRRHIIDDKGMHIAQKGMIEAVAHGIVFPFRTNTWPVAAKTGTAEFGTKNSVGEYQTHSWVTGYAPANDPKVSFTILLESGGSSTNAAQVANTILDWYAKEQSHKAKPDN